MGQFEKNGWGFAITILWMMVFLALATAIKSKSKFLRRHFVPAALIAGFIGMIVGPEVLNLLPVDLGFDVTISQQLVYHLAAVGFIAITLKEQPKKKNLDNFNTGVLTVLTYVFQAILGFGLSLLFLYGNFFQQIQSFFPAFGFFLPLGFGQGPSAAFNAGSSWEIVNGQSVFPNGGNIGLTVAALGFIWAFIGGVPLLSYLAKKYNLKNQAVDIDKMEQVEEKRINEGELPVSKTIHIDNLSFQLIQVALVYGITFVFLLGIDQLLGLLNSGFARTLADLFWGFNFLFGILFAIIWKVGFKYFQKIGWIQIQLSDNYLLSRISESSFDLMIVAGIASISINALGNYFWPVMIMSTLGGITTIFFLIWYVPWVYKKEVPEMIAVTYGTWTGTLTTGVALVREIDPYGQTNVLEHIAIGSGFALPFGLPLFLIPAFVVNAYINNTPIVYLYVFIALLIYYAGLHLILHFTRQK